MRKRILKHRAKALGRLDAGIENTVAPYRANPAVQAFQFYGKAGDQPPLRALCAGLIVLGVIRRDTRFAGAGLRMLAAHELATGIKSFAKHRIDRKRPRNADSPADNAPKPGRSRAKAKSSLPSGHSAGAIAVARAFGREFPEQGSTALGAAALIGASQVARSAHFATDVAVGAAIGWAAEAVVNMGVDLGRRVAAELSNAASGRAAPSDAGRPSQDRAAASGE